MKQPGLSNRELVAAYKLKAARLMHVAKRLELRASLMELAENAHELNARLSTLCPKYIQNSFEEQLQQNGQDREFLAQMCITTSPTILPDRSELYPRIEGVQTALKSPDC